METCFDSNQNVYNIDVTAPSYQRRNDKIPQDLFSKCLRHSCKQRFLRVGFRLNTDLTNGKDVFDKCTFLTKIIFNSYMDNTKHFPMHFYILVNRNVDLETIKDFQIPANPNRTRSLFSPKESEPEFILKKRSHGHYLEPAAYVTIKSSTQQSIDQIQTELETEMKVLLKAKKSTKLALHEACMEGDVNEINLLLHGDIDRNCQDKDGNTPLHVCSFGKNKQAITLLLQNGVDVNKVNFKGQTALHVCLERMAFECVALLVHYKCDVNIVDKAGDTAMHDVVSLGACTDLQDIGADCGVLTSPLADYSIFNRHGFNVLMWATIKNHVKAVEIILSRNNSLVNSKMPLKGYTSCHIAAANDFLEVTKALLLNGNVDVSIVDINGKSPLDLAVIQGYHGLADFLRNKGFVEKTKVQPRDMKMDDM